MKTTYDLELAAIAADRYVDVAAKEVKRAKKELDKALRERVIAKAVLQTAKQSQKLPAKTRSTAKARLELAKKLCRLNGTAFFADKRKYGRSIKPWRNCSPSLLKKLGKLADEIRKIEIDKDYPSYYTTTPTSIIRYIFHTKD